MVIRKSEIKLENRLPDVSLHFSILRKAYWKRMVRIPILLLENVLEIFQPVFFRFLDLYVEESVPIFFPVIGKYVGSTWVSSYSVFWKLKWKLWLLFFWHFLENGLESFCPNCFPLFGKLSRTALQRIYPIIIPSGKCVR